MKHSTTQVAAAVVEAVGVVVVENEDGVQWRRWGGHSMVVAAFDGGHTTTSGLAMRGQEGSATIGREGGAARGNTATSQRMMARGGAVRGRQEDETVAL